MVTLASTKDFRNYLHFRLISLLQHAERKEKASVRKQDQRKSATGQSGGSDERAGSSLRMLKAKKRPSKRIHAHAIKRIYCSSGELVGWLYQWNTGDLVPRWKSEPHSDVYYD